MQKIVLFTLGGGAHRLVVTTPAQPTDLPWKLERQVGDEWRPWPPGNDAQYTAARVLSIALLQVSGDRTIAIDLEGKPS